MRVLRLTDPDRPAAFEGKLGCAPIQTSATGAPPASRPRRLGMAEVDPHG
jgi:hypothetical protein